MLYGNFILLALVIVIAELSQRDQGGGGWVRHDTANWQGNKAARRSRLVAFFVFCARGGIGLRGGLKSRLFVGSNPTGRTKCCVGVVERQTRQAVNLMAHAASAGSSPAAYTMCRCGEIGIRARLRIWCLRAWRFDPSHRHQDSETCGEW